MAADFVFARGGRYEHWIAGVKKAGAKLVVIELGAGTAVPTVRLESEHIVRDLEKAELIRINIEQPEVPADIAPKSVSLAMGALDAISQIKSRMPTVYGERSTARASKQQRV